MLWEELGGGMRIWSTHTVWNCQRINKNIFKVMSTWLPFSTYILVLIYLFYTYGVCLHICVPSENLVPSEIRSWFPRIVVNDECETLSGSLVWSVIALNCLTISPDLCFLLICTNFEIIFILLLLFTLMCLVSLSVTSILHS